MRSSTVLFALVVVAACALQLAAASRPVQRIVISEGVGASPAVHRHQRNSTADFFSSPNAACHFGSLPGSCISAKESCGGSSIPDGACGSGGVCCVPQVTPKAGCGSAAITRAMTWVHVNLTYCQSPRGKPDYDKACKPVCERISNPEWNAYRSDCSAFVSWAYGIAAPGRVTSEFAPYENDLSKQLSSASELEAGDALNSVPAEHIMLFHSWLNTAKTRARLLEEPGCSSSIPWARVTDSEVTIKSDGHIVVHANGMTFAPIRFHTNSPVC